TPADGRRAGSEVPPPRRLRARTGAGRPAGRGVLVSREAFRRGGHRARQLRIANRMEAHMRTHETFMDRAMELATEAMNEGNRPAGCVIVKDGKIVGEGRNLVITETDPTAHGEIVAIRRTALNLGTVDL